MLCIFCLKEARRSEEHVFPEAIGGALTIDRVCKKCNDLLNKLADRDLIQYPTVRALRAHLGIPDKRGNTLDPFADIWGPGTIFGGEPGQRVGVRRDPSTGKPVLRLFPHRTEKVRPDGEPEIEIKIDARDAEMIPLIIQRENKRAGRPALSEAQLERAVSKVRARGLSVIEQPVVRHDVNFKFTDPRRGILKIAYELAWRWLGDDYLNDEGAQRLRQVTLSDRSLDDPESPQIPGIISAGEMIRALMLWNHLPNVHLALMQCFKGRVGVLVRVFNTLSAIIGVSEHADRYRHLTETSYGGNFLKLDLVSYTFTESTLADAIRDLSRDQRRHNRQAT
jgi:HNH endonuclease